MVKQLSSSDVVTVVVCELAPENHPSEVLLKLLALLFSILYWMIKILNPSISNHTKPQVFIEPCNLLLLSVRIFFQALIVCNKTVA